MSQYWITRDVDPDRFGHERSLSLLEIWNQFRNYENTLFSTSAASECYSLPEDPGELERLDVQNELLKLVLDRNYVAPNLVEDALKPRDGPAPAILDVGTGTGTWAIEMAEQFPDAEVLGIDVVATKPMKSVPINCRFEIDDVNLSLAHYSNCFNVVHSRLVDPGISEYKKFLNQAALMLRPGGVLLVVQAFLQFFSDEFKPLAVVKEGEVGFTFMQAICTAVYTAIKVRGGSPDAMLHYEENLRRNPNYDPDQIVVKDLFIPLGPWPTDLDEKTRHICELMRLDFHLLIRSFKPLLMADGFTEDVVDRWIVGASKELQSLSVKAYVKWRFAWAVRRKTPWIPYTGD